MVPVVVQIKSKRDFIKKEFRSGVPVRYNTHISAIIRAIDKFIEIHEKTKKVELSEDSMKIMKENSKLIITLTDCFENKIRNKNDEVGKIIEATGLEFYRNTDSPEISGSMVIIDEKIKSSICVCIPLFLGISKSGEIRVEDIERLPVILIKPETASDCSKWLAALHEFSHILVKDLKELLSGMPSSSDSHLNEFFSDLVATDIAGFGFLIAACKNFEGLDAYHVTERHPSKYHRIRAIYERLKSKKSTEANIKDICKKVYKKWINSLSKTKTIPEPSALRPAKRLLEEFHKKKKVEFFIEKKWKQVKKMPKGKDIEATPIALLSAFSLSKFLPKEYKINIDEKLLRKRILDWLEEQW